MKLLKFSIIALVTLVFLAFLLRYFKTDYYANLTIKNAHSEPILRLKIDLCGETAVMENVPVNESKTVKLKIPRECGYSVEVQFQSGLTLSGNKGYVTPDANTQDTIVITEKELILEVKDNK